LFNEKPQAGGYLGIEKQLGREIHNAINQIVFHHRLAYLDFVVGFGSQRAIRQYKACLPGSRQVIQEVLYPGVVGIGWWRS